MSRRLPGLAAQALALYASRRRPRHFWPLMTAALIGSGASVMPPSPRNRAALCCCPPGWAALGLGAGIGLHLAAAEGARVIRRFPAGASRLARVRLWTGSRPRAVAALLVIPAAVGEELYWRADPRPGDVASYAACQLASGNLLLPLGAVPLGLLTTWLRQASGCLWPALFAHLAFTELTFVAPGLPGPAEPTSGSPAATEP